MEQRLNHLAISLLSGNLSLCTCVQNYVRVVEVWWDEYKDYFYASRPETLTLAYGDISTLKKFREEHRCKSFKWFMEEVAYDIPLHYPLPPKNVEWGEVRSSHVSAAVHF